MTVRSIAVAPATAEARGKAPDGLEIEGANE
jgi:hypothetical protein